MSGDMSRFKKYFTIVSLWVAWGFMTAHLLIPHDHHIYDFSGSGESSCPLSDNKTSHSSGLPLHCHAFNDSFSEKATTFVVINKDQVNDDAPGDLPWIVTIDINFPIAVPITELRPLICSGIAGLFSLRGPPPVC
jgi:hypothetical protein